MDKEATRLELTKGSSAFRAVLLGIVGLLLLVVLAAGAALYLLQHLDSPTVRERIVRSVREAIGIEMDYDEAAFSLSGNLFLAGVRVFTPEPYRSYAPVLAQVERLEVSCDIGSFVAGPIRVTRVAISGVQVTLVQDETGRTSLEALLDAMPKPEREEPPTRLSRGVPIERLGITIADLEVRDVVLTRLVLENGALVRTETLEGLALDGALDFGSDPPTASLTLKSPDGEHTRLVVQETGPAAGKVRREATIRHATRLRVDDPLRAHLDLEISEVTQDVRSDLVFRGPPLEAGIAISFYPEESRIGIEVERMTLAGGVATGTLRADLREGPDTEVFARIEKAEVACDLDRLPEALRALVPQVQWTGGNLRVSAEGVEALRSAPWMRVRGRVSANLGLPYVSVVAGERRVEVRDLAVVLDALETPTGSARADASLVFTLFRGRKPGWLVTARDGSLTLGVGVEDFLQAISGVWSGTVTLKAGARMASLRTATGRLRLAGVEVEASAPIASKPPHAARGEVRLASVTWRPSGGDSRLIPGGRLTWSAEGIVPDSEIPLRSRGRLSLRAEVAEMSVGLDATKEADEASLSAMLQARSLALFSFLAAHPALRDLRIPLGRLGLTVKTEGRVRSLGDGASPTLDQKVTIAMSGLQATTAGHRIAVPSLSADLAWTGRIGDLHAKGIIEANEVRVDNGVPLRRLALTTEARVSPSAPEARVLLSVEGRRGPMLEVHLDSRVTGRERTLSWSGSLEAQNLSDVSQLLPANLRSAVDIARLQVNLKTQGHIGGLLGQGLRLVARPLDNLLGRASLQVSARGLAYRSEPLEIEAPDLQASIEAERSGMPDSLRAPTPHKIPFWSLPTRLRATLEYSSLRVDQRVRRFEVFGGSHGLETDADPASGEVRVSARTTVARVAHEASARYPVERATLKAVARISRLDAVRLDEFSLDNPAGGTHLEATAALDDLGENLSRGVATTWDLVVGRRSLAVIGLLEQRLDPLSHESFVASGTVRVPFAVQSGDRSLFRVTASIQAQGVSAEMPKARLAVRGLNGVIPIEEEIALSPDGPLVLQTERNLFSRVRFLDQHPFLKGGGFVALDRLVVGPLEVGPVAGNLRIYRNILSLDQIEAAWRDGKVTGQVMVDYHPKDTRVSFRGKVTGLKPTGSEERLDANAAMDLSIGRRDLAGRVNFVRVGRGHLLDLLDAFDPYHENVSVNRIRTALKYGYPKYARVRVEGGFLNAKVELGGLGALVRIDEVRGIPTGPFLTRALGGVRSEMQERQ